MARQMLILCTCIIMAFLTYELPFFGTRVLADRTIQLEDGTDELSLEMAELFKKPVLNPVDADRLTELVEIKGRELALELELEREKLGLFQPDSIDYLFEPGVYEKFRKSSIAWLVFVWVIFLSFIPKSMLEFFEAIFLPVIWYIFSGIILIEIAIILSLSFFIYLIKQKIKKNRKECSTKG